MSEISEANPYAAPASKAETSLGAPATGKAEVDFRRIMRCWEKLRILFNGVLGIFVLALSFFVFPQNAANIEYWFLVGFGGVFANMCYFCGPTIEAYCSCFRLWHISMTIVLFAAGLGLTAMLALVCIASYHDF